MSNPGLDPSKISLSKQPPLLLFAPAISSKITPIPTPLYSELDEYRKQLVEKGSPYTPYSLHKQSTRFYRAIFIGFGVLFLILLSILYMHKASWFYTLYFGGVLAKTVLSAVCVTISSAAFFLAWQLRAEREGVWKLVHQAKQKIARIYAQKRGRFGLKRFLIFSSHSHQAEQLKHAYLDALEKMDEVKEVALCLLTGVSEAREFDVEYKERLFNDILLEMQDKLSGIIHSFKA